MFMYKTNFFWKIIYLTIIYPFVFLSEEYNKQHSEAATVWDIRLKGKDEQINESTSEEKMDIDEEEIDLEGKEELLDTSTAPVEETSVILETSLLKQDEDLKKELTEEALPESEMSSKSLTKWVCTSLPPPL